MSVHTRGLSELSVDVGRVGLRPAQPSLCRLCSEPASLFTRDVVFRRPDLASVVACAPTPDSWVFSGVSHGVASASELPLPHSPHVCRPHGETRGGPGSWASAAGFPEHTAFTRRVSPGGSRRGLFPVFFLRQDNCSSSFHLLKVFAELTAGSSGLAPLPSVPSWSEEGRPVAPL